MDYSIIDLKNTQLMVKAGDTFTLNGKLGEAGTTLKTKTLLTSVNGQVTVGTPNLADSDVQVLELVQSKKIQVLTFKSKSRYRKAKGHRQWQTRLQFGVAPKAPVISAAKSKAVKAAKKPVKKV